MGGDGRLGKKRAIAGGLGKQSDGIKRLADGQGLVFKFDRLPRVVGAGFGLHESDVVPFIAALKDGVDLFVIPIDSRHDDFEIRELGVGEGIVHDLTGHQDQAIIRDHDAGADEIDFAEFVGP